MLKNRTEAAERLAGCLASHRGSHPLVLGVPRGGVPMARILADGLDGDLDVLLVHKLGAPGNPEYAIGAVDENGRISLNAEAMDLGLSEEYVRAEAARQLHLLRERRARYTPWQRPRDPAGRTVILVDDGIATGATMRAAIQSLRLHPEHAPTHVVVAAAVMPRDTLRGLQRMADEVVCLECPEPFWAVGQAFEDFSAVSDDEVVRALREFADARRAGSST
jgi:predicted phosphoribosyltransferase